MVEGFEEETRGGPEVEERLKNAYFTPVGGNVAPVIPFQPMSAQELRQGLEEVRATQKTATELLKAVTELHTALSTPTAPANPFIPMLLSIQQIVQQQVHLAMGQYLAPKPMAVPPVLQAAALAAQTVVRGSTQPPQPPVEQNGGAGQR